MNQGVHIFSKGNVYRSGDNIVNYRNKVFDVEVFSVFAKNYQWLDTSKVYSPKNSSNEIYPDSIFTYKVEVEDYFGKLDTISFTVPSNWITSGQDY